MNQEDYLRQLMAQQNCGAFGISGQGHGLSGLAAYLNQPTTQEIVVPPPAPEFNLVLLLEDE